MNLDIQGVHMPVVKDYHLTVLRESCTGSVHAHIHDLIVELTLTADHGSIQFGANLHLRWATTFRGARVVRRAG
ncbi:MAG: hypothetical protein OXQ31_06505 [Spirochaetaceae bacterium]|nr:hypothetical protein [Spirochaetaceae bacterium]